jgi:hypothetical protein
VSAEGSPNRGAPASASRRWTIVLVGFIGAVVVAALLYPVYRFSVSGGPSDTGLRDLQAQGQSLIEAVERYKAQTGRYPQTLEQAGTSAPLTWWGRWRYGSDGNSFTLEIGDYSDYEFLMYWDGDRWMVDK